MNIANLLKNYFEENKLSVDCSFSIIREDGIVLYSNLQKKYRSESIGALAAGVWQAATALNSTIDMKDSNILDFRLSFDKADEGVYLLGFELNSKKYLLCALYDEVTNPAKLKMLIRKIKQSLLEHLTSIEGIEKSKTQSNFLFQNITDAEMDKLFEYGGA